MRNQRPSHEHDRRQPVEQPQLAHGIRDIDIGGRGGQLLARTQGHMQAGSRDGAGDGLATGRMPRHDHAEQRWKEAGQHAMGFNHDFLLARMGRGRDNDRTAARHRHQALQPGGVGGRRRDVEFQISRGDHVAAAARQPDPDGLVGAGHRLVQVAAEPRDVRLHHREHARFPSVGESARVPLSSLEVPGAE